MKCGVPEKEVAPWFSEAPPPATSVVAASVSQAIPKSLTRARAPPRSGVDPVAARSMRGGGRAVLFQAVGRTAQEGERAHARWAHVGRDAAELDFAEDFTTAFVVLFLRDEALLSQVLEVRQP